MEQRNRTPSLLLICFLASSVAVPAWAQQPGPGPGPAAARPEQQPPEPEDPAVAAVLSRKAATPPEWARAAKDLAELGRPDLGRQFLKQMIDAKLSDQQLADLADQFGTGMLLSMATREEMLPEARQLADAILAAVNRSLQDPARIAELIGQLQDPSAQQRLRALTDLGQAGSAAVGPLVAVLTEQGRAAEHAAVRAALAELRSDAVDPLVGLLEASNPRLVTEAIRILAQMGAKQAGIYLLRPCCSQTSEPEVRATAAAALKAWYGSTPTKPEALRLLRERAKAYFDHKQPIKGGVDGRVQLWRWDENNKQCVPKSYPADEAACAMAARLARDAYALAKEDPQIRLLYLTTMLEEAAYEAGLDEPLPDGQGTATAKAADFGAGVIEDLLQHAIAGDHVPAATAAARILGRIGTADELLRQAAQPAPLVRAARHPDRRLRMAATDAVIRLQPAGPFPGSSYIPQSLAFFAASSGTRRALVAGPSTEDSRRLAGWLAGLGFEVDTAVTGRELGRLASQKPDYELALIDAAIDRPPVDFLLQQLRHDCRSATLRVGLIARSGQLGRADRVARRDPLALAFSRPHSDESFAWQIEQLRALEPRALVDHAQRQRQAAEALDRLVELSSTAGKLYDMHRTQDAVLAALYTPGLSSKAAAVLGNLRTPESQRVLVELASRPTQPVEVRQAAAKAFRRNTQAGGILLTTGQILRQYERYNQSQNLDSATQQILGLILDCIEAPTNPGQAKKEANEAKMEAGEGV
jgi:hypothetical protein